MTDWTLVGGNPAPGDVAGIDACAVKLRKSAKDAILLKGALERIQRNSDELRWHGEGGDAFRARLRDVPGFLGLLCDSHEELSSAFSQYATTLGGLQSWATQLLQMAVRAQTDAAAARRRLDACNSAVAAAKSQRDAARSAETRAHSQWSTYAHSAGADPAHTAVLHQRWTAAQTAAVRASTALSRARTDATHAQQVVGDCDERMRIARAESDKVRGQARDARRLLTRRISGASHIRIPDDPFLSVAWHWTVDVLRPNSATETYLRFLSGLSQTVQWIGMIPIPGLSLVTGTIATGIAITILFGRFLQALYGQRPWSSLVGSTLDVGLTATSMIPMGKALGKASLLGQAKRAIWYDDARHAVGDWRKVKVAPKLASDLLKHYPELSASTVYRVGAVLHWTNEANQTADKVANVADFGYGVYYDMKGRSWSALPSVIAAQGVDAIYGDGTADDMKSAVQSAVLGDVQGTAAHGLDVLHGHGTADHVTAAVDAVVQGDVTVAVDQGARAAIGDETMDKITQSGDDMLKGDIIAGVGDLGD